MDSKKSSIEKVLDFLKQLLLLLILQLIFVNPSIGQYEDWSLPTKVIQNEVEYTFKNSIISISPSSHISIKIDSSSIFDTLDNINSLNSNFGYYQIDSVGYSAFYIKDFKNDTSFLLKKGNFSHVQCFDNFLVLFGTGKYRITVFNFKLNKIDNYSFYARPIGNDDTSIYIVTNDFRHNNKKYRYGTNSVLNVF